MGAAADRKLRGAWYTPAPLVRTVVDAAVTRDFVGAADGPVRIVDPACGDGRFLRAAAQQVLALGGRAHVVGVDVDASAVAATTEQLADLDVTVDVANDDALTRDWSASAPFDLVIGNPPFLSQMAAATTRGGSTVRSGGPYADVAVEFLALGAELVAAPGGRVAFVLPQSLLSARDAAAVRAQYDERAELVWSWWTGEREFDAQVLTCALVFEFGSGGGRPHDAGWGRVVTSRRGVPDVPSLVDRQGSGRLGDRARLNANFRDEYYGMVGAVGDHADGPPLITSGLIDPGRSLWGERPVTFAKQRYARPRLDLSALDTWMQRWADERLVPKVLVANQTKILEAVVDAEGSWLPGVPVVAIYPNVVACDADEATETSATGLAWEIGALLTSPVAAAWAWRRSAGTGLSADAIRVGPVVLADLPWPDGSLRAAADALRGGDVRACAAAVHRAFGLDDDSDAASTAWWTAALERIEARQPRTTPR